MNPLGHDTKGFAKFKRGIAQFLNMGSQQLPQDTRDFDVTLNLCWFFCTPSPLAECDLVITITSVAKPIYVAGTK